MSESDRIQQAKTLLERSKSGLSRDERRDLAIDLAALLLEEAESIQTSSERALQHQLARMMVDPNGKAFTTAMTDQAFRTQDAARVANQIRYLLDRFGIPGYLSTDKRLGMYGFRALSGIIPSLLVPLTTRLLRAEMSRVILPGEKALLGKHMDQRREQGVRVNLNHLGEAILGEEEALRRLKIYLDDLNNPAVEYISVKISTICSQLNLLAWDETLDVLAERLRQLYRAAASQVYQRKDGTSVPKFVNLDMEEYRDLHLTTAVFKKVLDEPEFIDHSAGIVLQAYLPDSFNLQKDLTRWAMQRIDKGGAPIKVRIVKGANLAMEQVESALHGWAQAPYDRKVDVDANYKRMVEFGCQPEHARAVHLGVASHNLFDIAYALLLRAEMGVEAQVGLEMLEGMADHMRRAVHQLSGDMLLYCPAAKAEEFQNAVAYLIRRLDENTAEENFLRHAFGLTEGSPAWNQQVGIFTEACSLIDTVSAEARRDQDRDLDYEHLEPSLPFDNESETDFALPQNRRWVKEISSEWEAKNFGTLPVQVGGKEQHSDETAAGYDPSRPGHVFYHYTVGSSEQAKLAVQTAKAAQQGWAETSVEERCQIMIAAARKMRERRGEFLGAMMADGGKTPTEADVEISEAIDFLEYYWRSMVEHDEMAGLSWKPKGTVLVTPPWNFPLAIPLGGVVSSLITGNTVIFKPAAETVLVAWMAAQLLWEAGVPKEALQFFTCEDDPVGTQLIRDPGVDSVILTGATSTAKHFLTMRPDLDLHAETGGKNAIIVTRMADRDLAIKDIVRSAFGHAGQKCSACSLAILESDVYDDEHFLQQLRDAAASLAVGPVWESSTIVNPLIHSPGPALERGLTQLDEGEKWLLEPKVDPKNPQLWSPGIKIGVRPGSFTHKTELFGPVLAIMRAESLDEAIDYVNAGDYGLTSGVHSLDDREQEHWLARVEAGNLYVNRGITGAVVQRQPFGGCKQSSFGRGSKAGGPNYLSQLMHAVEEELPREGLDVPLTVKPLDKWLLESQLLEKGQTRWASSIRSYSYWMHTYFSKEHDPTRLQGQDNVLSYVPHTHLVLRVQEGDKLLDVCRVIAAGLMTGVLLEISYADEKLVPCADASELTALQNIHWVKESEEELCTRIRSGAIKRMRCLQAPSQHLRTQVAESSCRMTVAPILAYGRIELLEYLREVSTSVDYHRYGNLGEREHEQRRPLLQPKEMVHQ